MVLKVMENLFLKHKIIILKKLVHKQETLVEEDIMPKILWQKSMEGQIMEKNI